MTVTLRRDQAECTLQALEYVMARFDDHWSLHRQEPAVKLACKLAKERAGEVAAIFKDALNA